MRLSINGNGQGTIYYYFPDIDTEEGRAERARVIEDLLWDVGADEMCRVLESFVERDACDKGAEYRKLLPELAKALNPDAFTSPAPPKPVIELTNDEMAMVACGMLIQSIKSVRNRYNCGLKEAKEAVDAYKADRTRRGLELNVAL